jgi:hypothetical protein
MARLQHANDITSVNTAPQRRRVQITNAHLRRNKPIDLDFSASGNGLRARAERREGLPPAPPGCIFSLAVASWAAGVASASWSAMASAGSAGNAIQRVFVRMSV